MLSFSSFPDGTKELIGGNVLCEVDAASHFEGLRAPDVFRRDEDQADRGMLLLDQASGVNATESTARNTGVVTSYVVDHTTLSISDSIEISAVGDSNQGAEADSNNYGVVSAGGNAAETVSNVQTSAYLGQGVTVGAGDPIGGLTDGGLYYVVVDNRRPFISDDINLNADMIELGFGHGLQTGDTRPRVHVDGRSRKHAQLADPPEGPGTNWCQAHHRVDDEERHRGNQSEREQEEWPFPLKCPVKSFQPVAEAARYGIAKEESAQQKCQRGTTRRCETHHDHPGNDTEVPAINQRQDGGTRQR